MCVYIFTHIYEYVYIRGNRQIIYMRIYIRVYESIYIHVNQYMYCLFILKIR